jgi:phage baseplate assembly protein W
MATTTDNVLGQGLLAPLRREGSDYANIKGEKLVAAAIKTILRTRKGDIRWRPTFGVSTHKAIHKGMTATALAQLQAEIAGSLTQYEPRIEIVDIGVERGSANNGYPDKAAIVHVSWRAVVRGRKKNTVLTETQSTEVVI